MAVNHYTYYTELFDMTAQLCNIKLTTNPDNTFTAASLPHATIFVTAFNKAIDKIAKEKHALIKLDEETTTLGDSLLDTSALAENFFSLIAVKDENKNELKFERNADTTPWDSIGTMFYLPDVVSSNENVVDLLVSYRYIPPKIPLKYEGGQPNRWRFPNNIVDWQMVCYYATHRWYLVQGGEDDLKLSMLYKSMWEEEFNDIYSPVEETATIQNVYGGGIW